MFADTDSDTSQRTISMLHQNKGNIFNSTTSTTTNNLFSSRDLQKQPDSSLFGDEACGEPMRTQHIVLDFTLNESIDDEACQKKCCQFWEFIQNHPEFENLMVLPEPCLVTQSEEINKGDGNKSSAHMTNQNAGHVSRTAVSTLSFAEGQGYLDGLFNGKVPMNYCPLDVPDYLDHHFDSKDENKDKKGVCNCIAFCKCRNTRSLDVKIPPEPRAADLNNEMNEWDKEHPKSFESPRNAPSLQTCLPQQKLYVR